MKGGAAHPREHGAEEVGGGHQQQDHAGDFQRGHHQLDGAAGLEVLLGEMIAPLLIFAILCHTISAFYLKYSLLKVGIHKPLLPINSIC